MRTAEGQLLPLLSSAGILSRKGHIDFGGHASDVSERVPEKGGLSCPAEPEPGKGYHEPVLKNRFLESRDAVISQFRELSVILEEFSHQIDRARILRMSMNTY